MWLESRSVCRRAGKGWSGSREEERWVLPSLALLVLMSGQKPSKSIIPFTGSGTRYRVGCGVWLISEAAVGLCSLAAPAV